MDGDKEWHELDQISLRKSIREVIYDLPADRYEERLRALLQLQTIVAEEIAQGFYPAVSHALQNSPKDTLSEARDLVERLSQDLTKLGIAIEHPKTGDAMWLRIAPTPPRSGESWFQIIPVGAGGDVRPERLPRPIPFLKLRPLPIELLNRTKSPPHR
ncbi:MAG: hypothetical protein AB7G17_01105 [Phycisphaerales bacterium]